MRQSIADGSFGQGVHLAADTLATRYGVSRTPVREALRRLHSEGLVDFLPNRGAYVAGWTVSDVDEVFGLRGVLESYAARLAATSLGDAQLEEIAALAEETHRLALEQPPDLADCFALANSRLHRIIIDAAANRRLASMIASVVDTPLIMRTLHLYSRADLLRSASHHLELATAFRRQDPDWAASVMRSHLIAAHHVVREGLGRRGPG